MANLSIREAVKIYDVSRPTLTKALKIGKISGVKGGKGQWEIAPAEIARVYQPRVRNVVKEGNENSANLTTTSTQDSADFERLKGALAIAEARADAAERLAQERSERIEDLRRMLPAPNRPPKRSWWPWKLIGRKSNGEL